jgi:hypothetical protein
VPPPNYELPTAPDNAGAMDRLDREEMLQRLRDIDENTLPQYPSTILDPPSVDPDWPELRYPPVSFVRRQAGAALERMIGR